MYILGISAFFHDSAAVILKDDFIIAACQEERFTRKKQDSGFPSRSVAFCLRQAGISLSEVDYVVFYDKPLIKFERLLETYLAEAPAGFKSFVMAVPLWLKEKLFLKRLLADSLLTVDAQLTKNDILPKIMFSEHHLSHAASAFFPSPFEEAAVLTIDGVGEWTTTSLALGKGNRIDILEEIQFPHSLGLLYSAFTYYTGFKINSGEYKVMGLAPYGEPKYVDLIKQHLIDIKDDGSFRLNMEYFNYTTGLTMTNEKFHKLFGGEPREPESTLTQREMDLARSVQEITEEIMVKLARHAKEVTGCRNLCLAGGVALNCVGNGVILREKIFENIWIQPAAGDAGGALGAALAFYYMEKEQSRNPDSGKMDMMQGAYLGPAYSRDEVKAYLDSIGAVYQEMGSENELYETVSDALCSEKVVGWHQGRMEFGPRALGGRSIIGDARSRSMQSVMNLKIKYRESFRPFAPSVLRECVSDYFELETDSPYMLLVADVVKDIRVAMTNEQSGLFGIDKLNVPKSSIPSVTHVDYSARIQTVHKETNPRYWNLINRFKEKSGCGVVVNTSFNVRGEPIVCTPQDSYKCFMRTEMDVLAIENFVLYKENQPAFEDNVDWMKEFELD
jgi:carbamoyltransferase